MPRLFVALEAPPLKPLCEVLDALAPLRPAVKPVHRDRLHLTLRFLGEVPEDHVAAVAGAVEAAAGGAGPVELRLAGLGTFPRGRPERARVLFAEAADPAPLRRLADAADAALAALDPPAPARDKPFAAHLTLARIKRQRRPPRRVTETLTGLLHDTADAPLGAVKLKHVYLIESTLTPNGPLYRARCRVTL